MLLMRSPELHCLHILLLLLLLLLLLHKLTGLLQADTVMWQLWWCSTIAVWHAVLQVRVLRSARDHLRASFITFLCCCGCCWPLFHCRLRA
jgi:hypothetical protein